MRRLAGPMARRPLLALLIALAVCAGAATGFVRFGVDAGQSLLVGSGSVAGQANQRFTASFGTDPIVVVLTADNPTAPYIEKNLERLTALEDDLVHDPRVAQVLGPGTVARSALAATTSEVTKTLTEYPYFVAETDLLVARQKGETDTTKLQTQFQSDLTNARNLFGLYIARAAADAHQARQTYDQTAIPGGDRILDTREQAAEAAVAKDDMPPLFAEYLAGPGNTVDQAGARSFFNRITAAFGDCDSTIAGLLQITPTCQVYLTRILLDLPHCPTEATVKANAGKNEDTFCSPKTQWAAVLPQPSITSAGSIVSREIVTVRLTSAAAGSRSAVLAVQQKINDLLVKGIADDAYTRTFSANQLSQLKSLGALAPTECGDADKQQSSSCYSRYNNRPFTSTIAGAPLLTYGVVDSMTTSLLILLPVVMVLMAALLVAAFRVRGRLWPLLAAFAAGGATTGLALWVGIPITPAVLAGIPVLIGLGVDYAVQMVARYDEERRGGADREAALAEAIGRSGPATLTAAVATLAGLATLLVVAGIDGGPFVSVPLVAEFALVLAVGVILAWLTAVFVALPAAALRDAVAAPATATPQPRSATRTVAIASSWRGAVVPAVVLALLGWVLLPRVPVQTDIEQLLAPSLPQLQAINDIRTQTGYGNEIDLLVQGQVAGPYDKPGIPANVVWQCQVAEGVRTDHADQVALATSIADFFIASASSTTSSSTPPCTTPSTGTTPSPAPSATPSPSPSASAPPASSPTPTARRNGDIVLAAATATATPAPVTPLGSPSASPGGSASPSPSATPQPTQQQVTQTVFLCDLRLLPALARNLVQDINIRPPAAKTDPPAVQPCPAVDKYFNTWITTDTTPIDPTSARIVIGVQGTVIADQARLIDSVRNGAVKSAPSGITVAPAGLVAMAAQAYDNIVSRTLLLNLLPLLVVFLALLAIERDFRKAWLPVLPTAIAAGWAPLILFILGRLPGDVGKTLGSFNPLTVVLGALVIALATEFGVVLLRRFDEECAKGLHPDDAAAAALAVTGRAIRVSALTLGAGFAVLAISALFPHGLPLLGAFGFTVLIDLALAVAAVFGIMLPVAVAIERNRFRPALARTTRRVVPGESRAATSEPARRRGAPRDQAARTSPTASPRSAPARAKPPAGKPPESSPRVPRQRLVDAARPEVTPVKEERGSTPPQVEPTSPPSPRRPGVSGRRRPTAPAVPDEPPTSSSPRRPGVSGRRRKPPPGGGGT